MSAKVSVIILNWNGMDLLKEFLRAYWTIPILI